MNLLKKAVSLILTAGIMTSMMISASAVEWMEIYNSEQSHSETVTTLYTGDIAFEDGDVYRFTWEGTWYHGGISGGNIFIADSDSEKLLFWRDGTRNGAINGNITMTATDANPKPFKFEMLFDNTGENPIAYIDVYDIDKETVAGTITVDLTGIDGIKRIYHKTWNSTNLNYERPHTGKCVMEADASKMPKPSDIEWQKIYEKDGANRGTDPEVVDDFHELYDGELTSDSNYNLIWNVSFYEGGGVNNGDFVIADDDTELILFSKGKNNNIFDGSIEFGLLSDEGNPDAMVIETEIDFGEKLAKIKFWDDKNMTMLFGQKTVSLDGIDSIKNVYYHIREKGQNIFSYPRQSSLKIMQGSVYPKVRSVKAVSGMNTEILFGDGAIDLDKRPVAPAVDKILIDINTDIDIESLNVTLTAKGSDDNMLYDFTQKNYVLTGLVDGELSEDTEYVLKVDYAASLKDGAELKEPFELKFKTGKKKMTGKISNPAIADGKFTADIALDNSADTAKTWGLILTCYDERGCLIWCGIDDSGGDVSDTLSDKAEILLPDGALPEGTAKVTAYLWDSLAVTEMFADSLDVNF